MSTDTLFLNQSFDKKRLKTLISWVLKRFGEKEALRVVEEFKIAGFRNATQAGISIGLHDLITPPSKSLLVSQAQLVMTSTQQEFEGAQITATERSQRIIDTWHRASEGLKKQVVDHFSTYDQLNPVYVMALSGARGNFSQVRQLVGMRGLMADPQGQIISFPIRSNLREGLTLTEYFISCSGARKGLVDTALRTADTGYLTRRLVDVSHHIVVKRVTCDTHRGILVKSLRSENKVLLSLKDRLIGRVLAQEIVDIKNYVLAKRDEEISPNLAFKISLLKKEVLIRSPLTCQLTHEVCQLCYGWSLSQCSLVSLGEAVGVIAAQSIGEPGTQLTMRTFHTGGVFSGDLLQEIRAVHSGKVSFAQASQGLLIRTTHGRIAFLSKVAGELIIKSTNAFTVSSTQTSKLPDSSRNRPNNLSTEKETHFPFQALTMLFVRQGEEVVKNQLLAEFSILGQEGNQPIRSQQTLFAELSGRIIDARGGMLKLKGIEEHENEKKAEDEDEEKDVIRWIDPQKSGTLGLFRILSTRVGSKFQPKLGLNKSFFLKTIAEDGDLVDSDYKRCVP